MELKNSHGGYEGKTLTAKIQDRLDDVYAENLYHVEQGNCSSTNCPISNYYRGQVNELCWVLALIRESTADSELHDCRMRYVAIKNAAEGVLEQVYAPKNEISDRFEPR